MPHARTGVPREAAVRPGECVRPLDWLETQARMAAPRPALDLHGNAGESLTYGQLWEQSRAWGDRLHAGGVARGAHVALLSESRPRWALALFAAWHAGAVVVPLDTRLEEGELAALLADASPVLIIASAPWLAAARRLATGLPMPCRVESIEAIEASAQADACAPDNEADASARTALLVYTSGTGGRPKGVRLSHANLAFQVQAGHAVFGNDDRTAAVSILPLNHIFELTVGLLAVLHGGGRVRYCASLLPDEIAAAMQAQRVTAMAVVPLFLALLKSGIERQVRNGPRARRAAFAVARVLSRVLPWRALRRRLFAGLHARFGGALQFFISGGAPLALDVERFFIELGIDVYQGYGLTETSPVISTNRPGANRRGSVGRPLPGIEVRCVPVPSDPPAMQIATRGPHVMQGYHGLPALTAAAIDADGWFHTGDLGRLDADGFLHVTGRADNLIVLGNGKKVSPEEVEQHLQGEPAFREVAVLGRVARHGPLRGTREVCAVVVPADTLVADRVPGAASLQQRVLDAVRRRSAGLAGFKRPTRVLVHLDELPKTTTRKVRRPQLAQWIDLQDGLDERAAG
jgi:long-chain acyl-CoA synthetase